MPTLLTHAIAAAALAQLLAPCSRRREITAISAACAMLPDFDVLGFRMGIRYGDFLGHRGFTHSIVFAGIVAFVSMFLLWNRSAASERLQMLICVFGAMISHGVLDAFTNGGLGVAFLSPFVQTRYFFPATPIEVSPIGVAAFFTRAGLSALASEMTWVWCPSIIVAASVQFARRRPAKFEH